MINLNYYIYRRYVRKNMIILAEVTGARWCPWSSKSVRGVQASRVGSTPIHLRHLCNRQYYIKTVKIRVNQFQN